MHGLNSRSRATGLERPMSQSDLRNHWLTALTPTVTSDSDGSTACCYCYILRHLHCRCRTLVLLLPFVNAQSHTSILHANLMSRKRFSQPKLCLMIFFSEHVLTHNDVHSFDHTLSTYKILQGPFKPTKETFQMPSGQHSGSNLSAVHKLILIGEQPMTIAPLCVGRKY